MPDPHAPGPVPPVGVAAAPGVSTARAASMESARVRALVWVYVAFDVGLAIDLGVAEQRLARAQRLGLGPTRRAAPHLDYRPLPVRVLGSMAPVVVPERADASPMARPAEPTRVWTTEPVFDAVVFDFGGVSLRYRISFEGTFAELLALSRALFDPVPLLDVARSQLSELVRLMGDAIDRPETPEAFESYVVFQLSEPNLALEPRSMELDRLLARVLRSESRELSGDEVADAMGCAISYTPRDRVIIDWNAAVLSDDESDDVRAVLEYANVELLEMRLLDDRLDLAVDEAYSTMTRGRHGRLPWPGRFRPLARIARLQMDSAVLYEGVNNAIKLVGDQYLARVYRLAATRFHLPERDAAIERKLSTIESIYSKLEDRQASLRLEVLEWIVIVLIAVSIILPFVTGKGH